MSFVCLRWVGFEDAASVLCVTSRILRKSAGKKSGPPFPFEEQRGRMVTQTGPAYLWLSGNARCPHLTKPADFDAWRGNASPQAAHAAGAGVSVTVASDPPPWNPYFHDLECRLYNAAKRFFAELPEREALKALHTHLSIELDAFKMLGALQEPKDLDVKFPTVLSSSVETMALILGVEVAKLYQALKKSDDGRVWKFSGKPSELVPPGNVLYGYFQSLGDDPTNPDFEFSDTVESGAAPVSARKNPGDKNEGFAVVLGILQMRLGMWPAGQALPAVQRYIERQLLNG